MFRTRTIDATSTSTTGSTTRSVTRRAAAPLAALAMAASGLAVAGPAQAAGTWIGLEAFAYEPLSLAAPLATPDPSTFDKTSLPTKLPGGGTSCPTAPCFAADLPQPSIAVFTIIGTVQDKIGSSISNATAWKVAGMWVYRSADTRVRVDRVTATRPRVKILASRWTNGGAQALIADRVLKKSGTTGTEVETAYVFTGAVAAPSARPNWTVTAEDGSKQVIDVSGTLTGENPIDQEILGLPAGGKATFEVVPPGTDLS